MNPKKPTNLKVLQGTFRKDRAPKNEPMPEVEIPAVPAHLSDEAKVEWGRVSEELCTLGLLSRIDRAALAAYCECWADWVDASKMCASRDGQDRKVIKTGEKLKHDKDGNVTERTGGNFIENPYYSIKKRSAELMHKFLVEFGMTPASRSRINTLVDAPINSAKKNTDKNFA
jgi:P27 family predicted phage terminase small subunit